VRGRDSVIRKTDIVDDALARREGSADEFPVRHALRGGNEDAAGEGGGDNGHIHSDNSFSDKMHNA